MTSPDRPVESPAELLERAAVRLEELAHWATPLPWGSGEELTATLKILGTDAAWIAAMSPAVAAPLVAWLRSAALAYGDYPGLPESLMRSSDVAPAYGHTYQLVKDAIAFSKQILGESP